MSQELVTKNPFYPVAGTPGTPIATRHETLEQSLHVLFRKKWLILGLLAAFTSASSFAVLNWPPVRRAVAKILLKQDRVSLQISELSSASAKVPYSPQIMKSELTLIESRDVLAPVATALLATPDRPADQIPPAELEAKIEALSKQLVATAVGDTSVIQLEFYARTAEDAEKTLSLVLEQYLEAHAVAYSGSKKLLDFYSREQERTRVALEEAEERYRTWQKENDVVSIDEQITGLLGQESALQVQHQEVASGKEVALEENPLLNRIEADLVSANVGLQDLLARYTEQDRRVREKREQIALIKRQLATAKSSLMQSRSKQSGLIGKQIGDTRAQLVYLRERKVDGERLARVVALARDAFLLYGKKLEEARIAAQLSRDQLSNLAVVERPHATSWTDFDERIGTVLLAAIVGLTIGIAVAFAGALFNKSLRTRRDVEIHVGLPVLATIPDLRFAAIPDLRGNPS